MNSFSRPYPSLKHYKTLSFSKIGYDFKVNADEIIILILEGAELLLGNKLTVQ